MRKYINAEKTFLRVFKESYSETIFAFYLKLIHFQKQSFTVVLQFRKFFKKSPVLESVFKKVADLQLY